MSEPTEIELFYDPENNEDEEDISQEELERRLHNYVLLLRASGTNVVRTSIIAPEGVSVECYGDDEGDEHGV